MPRNAELCNHCNRFWLLHSKPSAPGAGCASKEQVRPGDHSVARSQQVVPPIPTPSHFFAPSISIMLSTRAAPAAAGRAAPASRTRSVSVRAEVINKSVKKDEPKVVDSLKAAELPKKVGGLMDLNPRLIPPAPPCHRPARPAKHAPPPRHALQAVFCRCWKSSKVRRPGSWGAGPPIACTHIGHGARRAAAQWARAHGRDHGTRGVQGAPAARAEGAHGPTTSSLPPPPCRPAPCSSPTAMAPTSRCAALPQCMPPAWAVAAEPAQPGPMQHAQSSGPGCVHSNVALPPCLALPLPAAQQGHGRQRGPPGELGARLPAAPASCRGWRRHQRAQPPSACPPTALH